MAHPVADIFHGTAELNRQKDHRQGNTLHFRHNEHVIVCGDIHGNRRNLVKVIEHAGLGSSPTTMLVLQEIVHGGPPDADGGDRSFEPLLLAARLKSQHPQQVHFLLGNHDLAQMTDNEISKDGQGVCEAFRRGLANAYGQGAEEVAAAIDEFFRSVPLAARCPNGVFISHSLPSPSRTEMFDPGILHRPYTDEDCCRGGSVYELVWGRRHDPPTLQRLAGSLGAKLFITSHQPQDGGFAINGPQLIVMSCQPNGVIAQFDANEQIEADALPTIVRRIAKL